MDSFYYLIFPKFTMEPELEIWLTEKRKFHYSECIQKSEQLYAWQVRREIMTKIYVVCLVYFIGGSFGMTVKARKNVYNSFAD